MSENLDYTDLAQSWKEQGLAILSDKFGEEDKKYIIDKMFDFALLTGEALNNPFHFKHLDIETKVIITQIVAEWTFRKACDLVSEGIPLKDRDEILRKIAFVVFQDATDAFKKNMPCEQCLQLVEQQVDKTYKEALDELSGNKSKSSEDEFELIDVNEAFNLLQTDELSECNNKTEEPT